MKRYYTAMSYAKLHHKQAGMTLIELTVVLLILIGLAGLLVPYVGSFVQKTHDSTNSSNLANLNNAFVRYVAENNRLPQHMDSLVNSDTVTGTGLACTGTQTAGDIYCGLLDPTMFATSVYTKPGVAEAESTLTPAKIAYRSLEKAKIGMWVDNNPAAANKTFGSSSGMVGIDTYSSTGSASPKVATVASVGAASAGVLGIPNTIEAHMAIALGKDKMDYKSSCYDYVAFGLGDANGLVSKTIAAAPVHYPEDATKGPVEYYNHYIAIVQVDKSNAAPCSSLVEPAKFLGVVMNVPNYPGSHLFGVNGSLGYAYENQLAGK